MDTLLEELTAADAQGERALYSLWPGDEFYYRGQWHEILRVQMHPDKKRLYITTTEETGKPRALINLQGKEVLWQDHRTFLLYGLLLMPALLTDEHADAERTDQEVW